MNSPWLAQLDSSRPIASLDSDGKTDIAIIGGGIAGISTAYYILRNTNFNVALLEANTIASGATGHNAGQVTAGFERSFVDMTKEFGLEVASKGVADIYSGWDLLEEILGETQIPVPLDRIIGAVGLASKPLLIAELDDLALRREARVDFDTLWISKEWLAKNLLPDKFSDLYELKPAAEIQDRLETADSQFFALKLSRKGCLNSALFCQELTNFMLHRFPHRINIYERSPVSVINLESEVKIQANNQILTCQKVVLCTNGFENFDIFSTRHPDLDQRFHQSIEGVIGYMTGYLSNRGALFTNPEAIAYFENHHQPGQGLASSTPYYYLTRRQYTINQENRVLTVLGGPESPLPEIQSYSAQLPYDKRHIAQMRKFLDKYYRAASEIAEPDFVWHGLMGYTPNGMRRIGTDKSDEHLLYNLGCNGVGILPSILGAQKISRLLSGTIFPASMFDGN